MIRFIRSLFAWRLVKREGVWDYFENSISGKRKAERWAGGGYTPQDTHWLEGRRK